MYDTTGERVTPVAVTDKQLPRDRTAATNLKPGCDRARCPQSIGRGRNVMQMYVSKFMQFCLW